MREGRLEKAAKRHSKRLGWITYKFVSPSMRAVPDRIFIRDGEIIFVEFKKFGEKPTKLQAVRIKELMDAGATVFVVDRPEQFEFVFE